MSSKVIFTTPRTEKQDGSYFVCIKPSVVLYETHMKDTKDIKRCIDDIEISDSWMMQMSNQNQAFQRVACRSHKTPLAHDLAF